MFLPVASLIPHPALRLAVGGACQESARLPGPGAALEEHKLRHRPHAPPRAQGAAFQAPERDTVLRAPAQTAGERPCPAHLPPLRAGAMAAGQGPPWDAGLPGNGRRTPLSARLTASARTPAWQDSPPSPTESGRPPSTVGDLAPPRQRPTLDRGPRAHGWGGGAVGGHSDKFMTNTGIINLL